MTKILIIEDNQANLNLMVYICKRFGYLTITASDGEEGIAVTRQEMPDLIICDIQLPKLNGYEIVKILKNDPQLQHIPIVAVTAYAMVGDRDKIRAAGFDAYMAKPINPAQFIPQLETLLPIKLRSNVQLNLQEKPEKKPEKIHTEDSCVALVVDNYLATRELFTSLLESIELEVIAVPNVKEAIDVVEKTNRISFYLIFTYQIPVVWIFLD